MKIVNTILTSILSMLVGTFLGVMLTSRAASRNEKARDYICSFK